MDYDYTHPENHHKDLIYSSTGEYPRESSSENTPLFQSPQPPVLLCPNCGWTSYTQVYSGYDSRLKVIYTRGNVGLWQVGPRWIIRDQPNDFTLGNDLITQEYLRNAPNLRIPLIKDIIHLSDPLDPIKLTLMSRVQGQPLSHIWGKLSSEQKKKYAAELAGYIRQWRRIQSPNIEKVNHDRLEDIIIGTCFGSKHPPSCKKMGFNSDAWFDDLSPELRNGLSKIYDTKHPNRVEMHLQELKNNFPKEYPNVITHGDLHLHNILVEDGKIQAIIDWEVSGFYPSWVEGYLMAQGCDYHTDELTHLLFEDGCLDFNLRDLQEQIFPRIDPVTDAWKSCEVEHPDRDKGWLRPRFCECHNYGGVFRWREIGNKPEHRIAD